MTTSFKFNPFTDKLDLTGAGGGGGGGVDTLTGNSGGAILPDGLGNINLLGSGAVTVAGSGNTLTITSANPFFVWTVEGSDFMAVTGHGYFIDDVAPVTVTLPTSSNVGDVFQVYDLGGNGWEIAQGANQSIILGNSQTTPGVAGGLSSIVLGDGIFLTCCETNLTWMATQVQGNLVVA